MNSLIQILQEQVNKARAAKAKGGAWGWLVYVFWATVITVGTAYVIYRLNARNTELAALRTKVEQDEVAAANARHAAAIAPKKEELTHLSVEAERLTADARTARVQLQAAQAEADAHVEQALAVRDWASLDAKNSAGRE